MIALPRQARTSAYIAAAMLVALIVLAAAAPIVAPYSMDALDLVHRRGAPSAAHWFGTDELGRDLLTRILFGARISLAIGLVSAMVSVTLGVAIGAAAGYAGRWVDDVLMRLTDAMLSVPRLPLLMIAAAVLAPGVPLVILLVGAAGWMETARVVRAEVQSIKTRDYVASARAIGAGSTTLAVGRGILLESAMSFFGVGVQPPTPSWGNMLYQAQTTMSTEPWLSIFPGAFIFVTVLCCNVLGDAVADGAVNRE
jgi:peptide/nickel transport system permease protein